MASKGSKYKDRLTDHDELDLEYSQQFQGDVEQEYTQFPYGVEHNQQGRHTATVGIQPPDPEQQNPASLQEAYKLKNDWKRDTIESLEAVINPGGADNYIPWSIINTLFCGIIIGLVALVFSIKSASHNDSGKRVLARKYSYIAYLLNILATLLGTATYITLYILYVATDIFDKDADQITWFPTARPK